MNEWIFLPKAPSYKNLMLSPSNFPFFFFPFSFPSRYIHSATSPYNTFFQLNFVSDCVMSHSFTNVLTNEGKSFCFYAVGGDSLRHKQSGKGFA